MLASNTEQVLSEPKYESTKRDDKEDVLVVPFQILQYHKVIRNNLLRDHYLKEYFLVFFDYAFGKYFIGDLWTSSIFFVHSLKIISPSNESVTSISLKILCIFPHVWGT